MDAITQEANRLHQEIIDKTSGKLSSTHEGFGIYEHAFYRCLEKALRRAYEIGKNSTDELQSLSSCFPNE